MLENRFQGQRPLSERKRGIILRYTTFRVKDETVIDSEWLKLMGKVISILMDMKPTSKVSVNDVAGV